MLGKLQLQACMSLLHSVSLLICHQKADVSWCTPFASCLVPLTATFQCISIVNIQTLCISSSEEMYASGLPESFVIA